jgi:ribosomal-protein-alanine N-acetyltransferase
MAQQPTPAHPSTMLTQLSASTTPSSTSIPASILTTSRLLLRPMHPADAPSMSSSANSPKVAQYMSLQFPSPYTVEAAETWIAMNTPLPLQSNFVICEIDSPENVIGGIGLKLGADISSHTAEVGFWVGERFWGRGYTTEALAGFTKWSFESFEGKDGQRLRRLWGGVCGGNDASARCFEKCGYAKEGVMKSHVEKNGEVRDMHLFGLTKTDWEARQ